MNENALLEAFRSTQKVEGLTHNFYRYPARFPPEFARAVIENFTNPGDCVLDNFMGGGTTIVEAVTSRRSAIGIDINPLANFITNVKTTPLSLQDQEQIIFWAKELELDNIGSELSTALDIRLRNMPYELIIPFTQASKSVNYLRFPRQRRFARCALLRLGQWALEVHKSVPDPSQLKTQLLKQLNEMFDGLNSFVEIAKQHDIPKNKLTSLRTLRLRSAVEIVRDRRIARFYGEPKLVLTSPPYPGVHVLYHRWQVHGRRETGAPYWLANLQDGHGPSYYTLGGRSQRGLEYYFTKITEIFSALHLFIAPNSVVVQMLAFGDPDTQLPAFLAAMNSAGYKEFTPLANSGETRPYRQVPNRKWYTYGQNTRNASYEMVLFHRPI